MSQFSELMETFILRAGVSEVELSRRAGLARSSVRNLRSGEARPKEESIRKLKTGLRWRDDIGVMHELTNDELTKLLNAAGYFEVRLPQVTEPTEHPDRCIVYSYWYSPDQFPSRWSTRVIELERSEMGNMSTMWSSLPSITRSRSFYVGAYERGFYHQDKVEAYIAAQERRQEAFLKRLETSTVRHLYSIKGIEDSLSGTSTGGRPQWHFWGTLSDAVVKQFDNLLEWLKEYDNFEVRLRETEVPGNITILGNNIVLIEFSLSYALMAAKNINGLELIGAATATQFTNQFEGFWADSATIKGHQKVIQELERLKKWVQKNIKK